MATLQTIRNRGGLLVSIVIGLALIAFIVGDALNSGSRIFNSQRNQIGEIAGEGVSIIDFQNRVSKNEEMIKAMNNVSSLNEEQQTMLRELMQREYDEIGIDVSGDELYDALLGENMSPALRQLFTNPNTGEIDYAGARDYVKKVISAPNNIPQKAYWLNMEKEVSDSRNTMQLSPKRCILRMPRHKKQQPTVLIKPTSVISSKTILQLKILRST